jgi:hypothetical protein
MGTNYYAVFKIKRVSPWDESYHERVLLHIGKRSGGWRFSWRGYYNHEDFGEIKTVAKWREVLGAAIEVVDEYNCAIDIDEFVTMATTWKGKSHTASFPFDGNWHDGYHSFSGNEFC